jgi:hypothetical protein
MGAVALVSRSRQRRSPLAMLDGWLRPLSRSGAAAVRARGPLAGVGGQVLAEVALVSNGPYGD